MAVTPRQVKNKRDKEGKLTGRAGTVYDVNIKYKTPFGEKKAYVKKGFITKQEAAMHEAEMKVKLQNPNYTEVIQTQNNQNLKEYLENWIETRKQDLRPSTIHNYTNILNTYITPNIGNLKIRQISPAILDNLFKQFLDRGLANGTVLCIKRFLSVSLESARKYRLTDINAAKDTIIKLPEKQVNVKEPYNMEQTKQLLETVSNTVWLMPVVLGGLYGLRRSEVVGLRWSLVDLENNRFTVKEQLPFKLPTKTKEVDEMAPTKSRASDRMLPITEYSKQFFLLQKEIQKLQKQYAEENGLPYYDNDLVVAKQDGTPILADWISTRFPDLIEQLNMPELRFHDLRHTAATNMYNLTGDFFTVGEILGHTRIGDSLGVATSQEMVTARYVEVRLGRKKDVLDTYHNELADKSIKENLTLNKSKVPTPKMKDYRGYSL